jgi:GT2 family glycosyltransferase
MMVSVIIPYYKRGEVFERGLDTVLKQEYPDREVIVVDDHSNDGLRERLERRQAGIKLIELPNNQGACAARNAGIRAASGDILAIIDDDVGFMSPRELTKLVKVFETRPDVHVVAFQICDPDSGELRLRDWCHPRNWKQFAQVEFETSHFGEGSSALRREVFSKAGLYYEPLFYGAEGLDMELRVLDQGFKILYTPRVSIWHCVSDKARTNHRQAYYFTRNYVWMAYKNYPLWAGMRFLAFKLAMMLYLSVRLGCYRSFVRGVWDGVRGLKRVARKPITRTTLKRWLNLEKERPGLLVRLARHRNGPQL